MKMQVEVRSKTLCIERTSRFACLRLHVSDDPSVRLSRCAAILVITFLVACYYSTSDLFAKTRSTPPPPPQMARLLALLKPGWTERVTALKPKIEEIMDVAGVIGLSLSVSRGGEAPYQAHFGCRDLQKQQTADVDTLYYIASRTKFMVGAAVGVLVDEDKLAWDSILSDILPDFKHPDANITKRVTISDVLSHRSGLAQNMAYWMAEHGRLTVDAPDFVKTATDLAPVYPMGSRFLYNNWGTALAAVAVEKVTGLSLGQFLKNRFFDPLDMSRTTLEVQPDGENVAKPYVWSGSAGDPVRVTLPFPGDGTIMVGAMGAKITMSDSLAFYHSFQEALRDQLASGKTSTPGNPFRQAVALTTPHVQIFPSHQSYGSYTLGWVRARLPTPMSHIITPNAGLFEHHPIVGKGSADPVEIFYHYSSLVGYLGAVILVPEYDMTILVDINTLSNSDTANWIASMVLETVVDVAEPNDFVSIVHKAKAITEASFPNMFEALEADQLPHTPTRPLVDYTGRFYNGAKTFYLDLFLDEAGTGILFNMGGFRQESYQLKHHKYDTWSWAIDLDETCRRERWPVPPMDFYLLHFKGEKGGGIDSLLWNNDPNVPEGERFCKA